MRRPRRLSPGRLGMILLACAALSGAAPGCAAEPPDPAAGPFTNSLGMRMVPIPAGEFLMGCGEGPPRTQAQWEGRDFDEAPAHKVRIARALFLSAREVTNAQYERFDPAHKKLRGRGGVSRTDDEPVTFVAWADAAQFCRWLSKREGRSYRLPTEAEWEYACRAGTTTAYHTGERLGPEQANIGLSPDRKRKLRTLPVGSYPPNAWGLHDMHGNVAEWCQDWHGPYAAGEQADPVGRAGGWARVARGGSYNIPSWQGDNARYCRSANRQGFLPEDANRVVGFRVALGPVPQTSPLPPAPAPAHQRNVRQGPAPRDGPDPKTPYFVNFTERKANPTIPKDTWGPIFSAWNHDTALCVCPNGDVLAVWYTTKSESGRELALAASRLPAGSDRWQGACLFFDVPDVNDHAPALLCHGKRVYHFSNQALSGWVDAAVIMRVSEDSGATWSAPRIILPRRRDRRNPHSLHMPVCAFATRSGVLGLVLDAGGGRSCLAVSKDGGESWRLTEGLIAGIHAATAEPDDGRLIAFGRGPDPMPVSVSTDLGRTWQVRKTPFGPIGVGQKAAALRLASGALLLCGPDTHKPPRTGRRGTFAALSDDGGKTWAHVRHLPGVGGYLSAAQAPNGVIHVFGTRMTCAAFNERWLREGRPLAAEE